ncbi:MAG: methylenetetrahydrofolate reductase [Proteobacteria bacterium]|nr:methylenetetrahydrofolate reductase [Pseudomonadota bacterium]
MTTEPMSFKKALRSKDFVLMAELPLTPNSTSDTLLADASLLRDCVDGFLLTDNQYGQPHMAPSMAASILLHNGFDPILQLSCRNRNRIALLGELLGARAIGVETLMIVRGNVLPEGYSPRPQAVMDIDAKDLMATAKRINEDELLGASREFLIATAATVHNPRPDWHPEELLAKADAGVHLIITQLCLDVDVLRRYMEALVSLQLLRRVSVIVSVAVVPSAELAVWLRENRESAIVPVAMIERLRKAKNPQSEGIAMCVDLVREIAEIPGVSGINYAVSADLETVRESIEMLDIAR